MANEGHVQRSMPFAGKQRQRGDVIDAEMMAATSPQVIGALVSQGFLVLRPEGYAEAGLGDVAPGDEVPHLVALVERARDDTAALQRTVDKLTEAFAAGGASFQSQIDGLKVAIRDVASRANIAAPDLAASPAPTIAAPAAVQTKAPAAARPKARAAKVPAKAVKARRKPRIAKGA